MIGGAPVLPIPSPIPPLHTIAPVDEDVDCVEDSNLEIPSNCESPTNREVPPNREFPLATFKAYKFVIVKLVPAIGGPAIYNAAESVMVVAEVAEIVGLLIPAVLTISTVPDEEMVDSLVPIDIRLFLNGLKSIV